MAFRKRIKARLKRVMGRSPEPAPTPQPPPPAPEATTAPPPAPKAAPSAPTPGPAGAAPVGPVSRGRPTGQRKPPPGAAAKASASGGPKEISPDKMRKAILRAKKGTLKFVRDAGGTAELADMHDHSERRYFVAHRAFSRLMEEITDEGLLHYDSGTGVSTMTGKGEAWLAENG